MFEAPLLPLSVPVLGELKTSTMKLMQDHLGVGWTCWAEGGHLGVEDSWMQQDHQQH